MHTQELYYSFYDGTPVAESPAHQTFSAPLTAPVPLHIRAGHIVPTQTPALTTYDTWSQPYALTVALKPSATPSSAAVASGWWVVDDGISLHTIENGGVWRWAVSAWFPGSGDGTTAGNVVLSVAQTGSVDVSALR